MVRDVTCMVRDVTCMVRDVTCLQQQHDNAVVCFEVTVKPVGCSHTCCHSS